MDEKTDQRKLVCTDPSPFRPWCRAHRRDSPFVSDLEICSERGGSAEERKEKKEFVS